MMERLEALKLEKELKRKELQEHARNVLRTHKKGSPRYKELERKFNEQVELEDLETKKKRLSVIREMYKPIDHKELDQHAMKVAETLKKQEEERAQK
jgi:hypothetical protein